MELIEKLIKEGFLDKENAISIEERAEKEERKEEEILLEENLISEDELFKIKSEILNIPIKESVDLEGVPENVKNFISKKLIDQHKMIPVGMTDSGTVEIGMVYPEDLRAQEVLKFILKRRGLSYNIYLIYLSTFNKIKGTGVDEKDISNKEEVVEDSSDDSIKEEEVIKKDESFIETLVSKDLIKEEDKKRIEERAEKEERKEEEILLEENLIPEDELFKIKSEFIDIPFKKDIDTESITEDVLNLINEDSAEHYKMIPISKEEDVVEIGMVYPEDPKAQEALRFISRQQIFSYKIYLISLSAFNNIKSKARKITKDVKLFLLEELINRKLLDKEKKDYIEEKTKKEKTSVEEILLEEDLVSEEDLFKVKSEVVKIPFKEEIEEEISEDLIKFFPKEEIEYYKMIPISKEEDTIEIGMVYPENVKAVEALDFIAEKGDFKYKTYLITINDFKRANQSIKSITKEVKSILNEKLIERGLLNEEKAREIEELSEQQEKTKEEVILEKELVSEEELFKIKGEILGLSFNSDVDSRNIPEDVLGIIPEDSANYYKMAPIGRKGGTIEIGMVYPENLRAKEALRFLGRRRRFSYDIYIISLSTFNNISKQYRTLSKQVGEALEALDTEIEEETKVQEPEEDIGKLAEEAPIVKVVGVILRNAVEGGASDVHIEPTREKLKVRFRVDGKLHSSLYLPMETHLATIARVKILSGLKIDEQRIPQDGRFSSKIAKKAVDFRVATLPTTLGEKVVIRVLDPTEGLKSIESLGVTGKNFEILTHSIKKPTGMTLVTGPTGSGKTTTLYSLMNILNNEGVNIVTLEDPVEYFIDGVNQSQINADIGYVFSKGLRQILRQDPDIIMVGEIRDEETADLAVHAALTGHIVLSTLHTNNAVGVIPRLVDMGIKPFLLPPSLNTAMAQRLVRKLCDNCKEQITPSEPIKEMIMEELRQLPEETIKSIKIPHPLKVYKANGCKYCSEEGYEGRTGIFEILKMTEVVGEITMENPTKKELEKEVRAQGMVDLKKDGFIKSIQGFTTVEEVLRATEEK